MKGFFLENSQVSMTRLLSFILVIAGIIHAFLYKDLAMASMLIGFGVTGKVGQKVIERGKNGN